MVRCISGRENVYGADMVGMLMGPKGSKINQLREESGLRRVQMSCRSMRSFGAVNDDPRLHLVVHYAAGEADGVARAARLWCEQLARIHRELADRHFGKGKGKGGKGKEWPGPPVYPDWGPLPEFHRPPPPPPPPPPLLAAELELDEPVLMMRRKRAPPAADGQASSGLAGPKILEATCLRGRELRWMPWPDASAFNEAWQVVPLRWGLRGELFVLLRSRETGETRVCAAEVQQPLEKWPVLCSPSPSDAPSKAAKYKSFTFNDHLFVVALDRELRTLKVHHVPDPANAWSLAFETALGEDVSPDPEGFQLSRLAKLCVVYAPDRTPCVVVVEPRAEASDAVRVFRVADPGKPWVRCACAPQVSARARLQPVYTKAEGGAPGALNVGVLAVDACTDEMSVFQVPRDLDKPWTLISKQPFAGVYYIMLYYNIS